MDKNKEAIPAQDLLTIPRSSRRGWWLGPDDDALDAGDRILRFHLMSVWIGRIDPEQLNSIALDLLNLALKVEAAVEATFHVSLKGDCKLDGDPRIGKRLATWEHAEQSLRFLTGINSDEHAQLFREMQTLKLYGHRPGVTKEQAVNNYNARNPEAPLPIIN
jgi:hypothetical protein